MSWVAVDKDGSENVFTDKPFRNFDRLWDTELDYVGFPKGSIKKLLGYKLTWEDEAVEIGD